MVSTSSDDQRPLWPFLLDGRAFPFDVQQLRLDDRETPHGTRMPSEDVCAPPSCEIPDSHRPIGGSADERVFACCEGPNAAFVAFEGEEEVACEGRVDMDGVVVRGGDDAVVGEDKAGDDG